VLALVSFSGLGAAAGAGAAGGGAGGAALGAAGAGAGAGACSGVLAQPANASRTIPARVMLSLLVIAFLS
jgi:amino acid transporter